MKSSILTLSALLVITLATTGALAQKSTFEDAALNSSAAGLPTDNNSDTSATYLVVPPHPRAVAGSYRPFSALGLAARVGVGGAGFDIATPLARKLNLRTGTDFFSYAASFQEEGANVGINLHLRSSHVAADWFPFGGRFRLSPQLVVGNNNRILATAVIPSGTTLTLNGQDYISSYSDPLHGSGRIDFRKVSPGLSFGFGNLIPRDHSHFSVPVEAGFYYVGQPQLQVAFTGSACDPNYPPSVGCESVNQDSSFQQSLVAFKARNDHNLSYASFFPIFSIGVGYRFW